MRISDWSSDVCSSDLQTVKQVRAQTLGAGFSRAGTAAHADNVGAGAPRIEHVGYQLGRVLQIRVQNNDGLARGLGQAGGQGGLLAEITAQPDGPDVGVGRGQFGPVLATDVAASAVDEQIGRAAGRERVGKYGE